MRNYLSDGESLRFQIKSLVLEYMQTNPDCASSSNGMKQAEIFRACGLDWDDQANATSSQQHFWLVALLRVLEEEGIVQRDSVNKKWRLK